MAVSNLFSPNRDLQEEPDIETIASHLALDIVYHTSGLKEMNPCNRHAHTMRHVVAEIIQLNELKLNSCILKLNINEENSSRVFDGVLTEMFSDKQMNWGRVATVYALAGKLAKHCYDNGMVRLVGRIGKHAGNYVAVHLGHWIEEQGGWDAFDAFFTHDPKFEDILWQGLWKTLVGFGVLLAVTTVPRLKMN